MNLNNLNNLSNAFNQVGNYNPEYLNDIANNEIQENLGPPPSYDEAVAKRFSYTPLPSTEDDVAPSLNTCVKSTFMKGKDKVVSLFANVIEFIKNFISNHKRDIATLGLSVPVAALYFVAALALGHAAIFGVAGLGCIAAVLAISGPILHTIIEKATA